MPATRGSGSVEAGDFDRVEGEGDSWQGMVPENLFTRSESKSSNLLMTLGSRIVLESVAGEELAEASGAVVLAEVDGGEDSEAYLLESSDCLAFSKIETVSAKTWFFLVRSFTSASCSSR